MLWSVNFDPATASALGQIPGRRTFLASGRNSDVDTGPEDIWEGGGTWVEPTTARTHNISSTSSSDSSAGTGARTVMIYGLTSWSALDPVTEIVTMNGTTNVPTTNAYVNICSFRAITFGSSKTNAGIIRATAQVDNTVTSQMAIGAGQSLNAVCAVPAGNFGLIHGAYASLSRFSATSGAQALMAFKFKFNADLSDSGWITGGYVTLSAEGNSAFNKEYKPPLVLPPKTLMKITAVSVSDADSDICASIDIEYVKI